MAQIAKLERYDDGNVVLSNLRNNIGAPVFAPNSTISASRVTEWWDGTPMTDDKVDGQVYFKLKKIPFGSDPSLNQYVGDYFKADLPNDGELFLEKDTMQEMRGLSSTEILLLQMGYYKGVRLNGYYAKGDTPAPIDYFISSTSESDDGGSIIALGLVKLEHTFKDVVDFSYFGVRADDRNFDNYQLMQNLLNKKLPVQLTAHPDKFYYTSQPLRAWRSFYGLDQAKLRGRADINSPTRPDGTRNSSFTIIEYINKTDDAYAEVMGLDIDIEWDPEILPAPWSEQEHCVRIACSKNVHVHHNTLSNPMGDCVNIGASIYTGESRQIENSENCTANDNICFNPYRMGVSVTGGMNVGVKRNIINKPTPYVAAIDLEVSRNSNVLHNIEVSENVINHWGAYAINVHGGIDYTNGDPSFLGGDYTTKDIRVLNNFVTNLYLDPEASVKEGRAVNIAASNGSIKNLIIQGNRYHSPVFIQMYSYDGNFNIYDSILRDNKPLYSNSEEPSKFGNIWYCKGIKIDSNSCRNVVDTLGCVDFRYSDNIEIVENDFFDGIDREVLVFRDGNFDNVTIRGNKLKSVSRSPISFSPNASGRVTDLSIFDNPLIGTDSTTHSVLQFNRIIEGYNSYNNNYHKGGTQNVISSLSNISNRPGDLFVEDRGTPGQVLYLQEGDNRRNVQPIYFGSTGARPSTASSGFEYFNTTLLRPQWYYSGQWHTPGVPLTTTDPNGWEALEYSDKTVYRKKVPYSLELTVEAPTISVNAGQYTSNGVNITNCDFANISFTGSTSSVLLRLYETPSSVNIVGRLLTETPITATGNCFIELTVYK